MMVLSPRRQRRVVQDTGPGEARREGYLPLSFVARHTVGSCGTSRVMWDAELQSQAIAAGVFLVAAILPAFVPSRREPHSPFLSNQRWGYGGVIIVFVATTISAFISPPAVVGGSGLRLWAIDFGFAG